jgi:hypothetical protein
MGGGRDVREQDLATHVAYASGGLIARRRQAMAELRPDGVRGPEERNHSPRPGRTRGRRRGPCVVAGGLAAGTIGVGVGTYLFLTSRAPALAFDAAPLRGGAVASLSVRF